jgi:hypothetical protein
MAFIQPCFIRKNSPELRKKLEELGYEPSYPIFQYPEVFKHIAACNFFGSKYYGVSDDEVSHHGEIKDAIKNRGMIDCGTDEHLFLALAALRDDTDKEQWFITYKSSHPYMDYAAILCREDKWEDEYIKESQQHNFINTKPEDYHKANVNEIIRLYKEFDEDLKDLYED